MTLEKLNKLFPGNWIDYTATYSGAYRSMNPSYKEYRLIFDNKAIMYDSLNKFCIYQNFCQNQPEGYYKSQNLKEVRNYYNKYLKFKNFM